MKNVKDETIPYLRAVYNGDARRIERFLRKAQSSRGSASPEVLRAWVGALSEGLLVSIQLGNEAVTKMILDTGMAKPVAYEGGVSPPSSQNVLVCWVCFDGALTK